MYKRGADAVGIRQSGTYVRITESEHKRGTRTDVHTVWKERGNMPSIIVLPMYKSMKKCFLV